MKFISLRSFTHASTRGHSVEFVKGVPTFVPPALYAEVQALGAVPEEDLPEMPETGLPTAPEDPAERKAAIVDAMTEMVAAGRREDFTAAGAPHLKQLKLMLGWEVPAQERDAVWAEVNKAG
jgi:hypothetical protein